VAGTNQIDPTDWLRQVELAAGLTPDRGDSAPGDLDQAAELLEARHGRAGARFAEVAFGFGTDRTEVFEAKNASLRLSVDISLTWNREVYTHELEVIGDLLAELRPRRVLDLGCEQGIVTCFVASSLPEAEVTGIDRSATAIDRARELAADIATGQVGFETGDFLPASPGDGGDRPAFDPGPADLVICSRSMLGEALPAIDEEGWSTEIAELAAAALSAMTGEGGTLFLLERGSPESLADWLGILAESGLDAQRVSGFACDEPSNPAQQFTIAVARGASGAPARRVS